MSGRKDDVGRRRVKVASRLIRGVSRTPMSGAELQDFPLLTQAGCAEAGYALEWLAGVYDLPEELLDTYGVRMHASPHTGGVHLAFPLTNQAGAIVDMFTMLVGAPSRLKRMSPERGMPAFWFGQYPLRGQRSTILVSNPLDALKLARLGVKNMLASCCQPTEAQFMALESEIVYFAFEMNEVGREAIKAGLDVVRRGHRYVFVWCEAGVESARELETLSQLKRVYQAKRKMGG